MPASEESGYFLLNPVTPSQAGSGGVSLSCRHRSIIAGARPEITDRSERDIPMLLKRYPNLTREDITIAILDDRPWGGKGTGHLAPVQ